jgi:hypothetical protein
MARASSPSPGPGVLEEALADCTLLLPWEACLPLWGSLLILLGMVTPEPTWQEPVLGVCADWG